jgi:hypothetical protein
VVVVTYICATGSGTRTLAQCTPSGYTNAHASVITASDTNITSMAVSYKVMGATPDTSVSIPASAATTNGVAVAIEAYRGIDPAVLDATTVTASGINGGRPDAAAITPTTAGAWIVVCCGAAVAAGAVFAQAATPDLSTTTNHFVSATITSTTNDANVGMGIKTDWSSGAFNPAAWLGSTTTNTGSWGAATLALKPTLSPITGSTSEALGALAGSGAGAVTVKGTTTRTLGSATASATGTVSNPGASATLSKTLGTLSGGGTGAVRLSGQTAKTLGAATSGAAAKLALSGQAGKTLGAATATGGAKVSLIASAAKSLGGMISTAASKLALRGSISKTLDGLSSSGAGGGPSNNGTCHPRSRIGLGIGF